MSDAAPEKKIRLDKWLWHARFAKTRSVAAGLVERGRVRVNAVRVTKPGRAIRVGDVLTLTLGREVRVVRMLSQGKRRGPASEAQTLYEDVP